MDTPSGPTGPAASPPTPPAPPLAHAAASLPGSAASAVFVSPRGAHDAWAPPTPATSRRPSHPQLVDEDVWDLWITLARLGRKGVSRPARAALKRGKRRSERFVHNWACRATVQNRPAAPDARSAWPREPLERLDSAGRCDSALLRPPDACGLSRGVRSGWRGRRGCSCGRGSRARGRGGLWRAGMYVSL
jgi:hypothetical protein